MSVRFGNVLGSRGSVLTAFHRQIEQGGPVTVTHPDVTRFFMLTEEAVQLVIQAGALDVPDGAVMVLDMGEPVSIQAMAEALVAEADGNVEITHTGLRPGEKLHEILAGEHEDAQPTSHSLITRVNVPAVDANWLARQLDDARDLHEKLADLCTAMARQPADPADESVA